MAVHSLTDSRRPVCVAVASPKNSASKLQVPHLASRYRPRPRQACLNSLAVQHCLAADHRRQADLRRPLAVWKMYATAAKASCRRKKRPRVLPEMQLAAVYGTLLPLSLGCAIVQVHTRPFGFPPKMYYESYCDFHVLEDETPSSGYFIHRSGHERILWRASDALVTSEV